MEKDWLIRGNIPVRNKETGNHLLDLSLHYNHSTDDDIHHKPGNNLSMLGKGVRKIGGCLFDIRGIVQLSGRNSLQITTIDYPDSAGPVKAGFMLKNLHFLHASAWNIDDETVEIGEYLIRYDDESVERIPLVYRENILDWWGKPGEEHQKAAWRGINERTLSVSHHLRLFHLCWENPRPASIVREIELKSFNTGPGIMLVAITADPA